MTQGAPDATLLLGWELRRAIERVPEWAVCRGGRALGLDLRGCDEAEQERLLLYAEKALGRLQGTGAAVNLRTQPGRLTLVIHDPHALGVTEEIVVLAVELARLAEEVGLALPPRRGRRLVGQGVWRGGSRPGGEAS